MRTNKCTAIVGEPSFGYGEMLYVGNIDRSADIVRIDTLTNWSGDLTITVDCNL